MMKLATKRAILAAVAIGCLMPKPAMAVSGRSLAIGRAFSYGYNNPQPDMGSGPLGSSVYRGNSSYNVPSPGGMAPVYNPQSGALANSMRSVQVYTPMAPMTFAPSGGGLVTAPSSGSGYGNVFREMGSALAAKEKQGLSVEAPLMTSLAPATAGAYQGAMLRGEQAFRQGRYEEARNSFEAARTLSQDSAESLLSLAQTNFAMGSKFYTEAGTCLAKGLRQFPDLPSVRVRPKVFFGSADEYQKDLAALEGYVKDNPKDAAAMLWLGYLQYREGLVDKALNTLDSAMALSPSQDLGYGVVTLLDGISEVGQIIRSKAPPMGQSKDYSWAGVRLAMPKGFTPAPLPSYNQVLTGSIGSQGKGSPFQVTVYAYPLAEGGFTLKGFMDYMTDAMRQSPAVKDMTTVAEAEVPFQTGKALVRLFSYAQGAGDNKSFMGWVAFIQEPKDSGAPRMAYILGLAANEAQAEQVLPTLAAIAKSVVMVEPTSPSVASVDVSGSVVEDNQFQFSIVQPSGWAGRSTDRGYEMGQADFVRGSAVSPKVEVIVQTIPGTYTARSFGEEAVRRKVPPGMTREILSQGPARLAGQDGYQFVVSQKPEAGAAGQASVLIGRLICLDQPNGAKAVYAMVVDCRDAPATDAEVVADKIAATFKLLQSEPK